ncbi:MAG: class I SAM-dependent methyltransferase [Chlorobium sp.]|uniref:class I SAM-dependent methyltransferase n=1 Tax=Chlorobium sp. TaxID=1095 RepID=UPI0025C6EF8E|nr:class I SAM-dependent methyltransferase [Chlorobium sp.]MCF8383378.1 class I SAM-dependent methyltransferase [Chlorobium sp.]
METIPCPICGSPDFEPFFELPDRFDPSTRWKLVRSPSCGLLMLNPRPGATEIHGYYHEGPEGAYDPHLHETLACSNRDRIYLSARRLLLNLKAALVLHGTKKAAGSIRVLETGCSTGDLLKHLHRKKGIPAEHLAGIETDGLAADIAESHSGIRIYRSGIDELERESRFDRIVFWHALEHVHDLNGVLAGTAGRLEEKGVVVVALPNPESLDARRYRENWVAWDAPRHLWHFTPATLAELLEHHGLEIFRTVPWLADTLYTCWYSEKLAAAARGRRFGFRNMANALLQSALGVTASIFRLRHASTLVYFIRKRS